MVMHSSNEMPAIETKTAVAVKEAMMLSEFFARAQQQRLLEIPFSYIPTDEIQELLQKDQSATGLHLFSPEDCVRKCTSAYEQAYS